jgi:replicative DNA helicase
MVRPSHKQPANSLRAALPLFAYAVRQAVRSAPPRPPSLGAVGTGLPSVDALLEGGLSIGRSTLLAARPGVGGSSLLLGTTLAALKRDLPVAYLSEHLDANRIRGRLVVLEARINNYRFAAGLVSAEDRAALAAARERISWNHLSLLARKRITIADIERHLITYHPQLVIADLRPRPPGATQPSDRFASLLTGVLHLGQLAQRFNVALVLRVTLPKGEGAPSRDDLPGLGALAQSFGTVLLLHREQVELPHGEEGSEPGLAELQLLRHRGRDVQPPAWVTLRFDQRYSGFAELAFAP